MGKLIRKKSLSLKILKGVSAAGIILITATSPYFGLNLIKNYNDQNNKKAWRKFYHSLNYLKRRGYVKIVGQSGDKLKVQITSRGKKILRDVDINNIKLKKAEKWDGKWRLVIFDVPTKKNKNRLAFTEKLKELGFIIVQKSVWAYPFECHQEIMILRKFYEIERYVTYLEANEIEDELDWRSKFNLKHQLFT